MPSQNLAPFEEALLFGPPVSPPQSTLLGRFPQRSFTHPQPTPRSQPRQRLLSFNQDTPAELQHRVQLIRRNQRARLASQTILQQLSPPAPATIPPEPQPQRAPNTIRKRTKTWLQKIRKWMHSNPKPIPAIPTPPEISSRSLSLSSHLRRTVSRAMKIRFHSHSSSFVMEPPLESGEETMPINLLVQPQGLLAPHGQNLRRPLQRNSYPSTRPRHRATI